MEEISKKTANVPIGSSVPPPPAEVKVRTMKSDIEGIAKAGGGSPQFKTVAVEGVGLPNSRIGNSSAGQSYRPSNGFPWWIIMIGIVVLIALVWFGYTILAKR